MNELIGETSLTNHLSDISILDYERVSATKLSIDSTISKVKLAQISCFHSHLKTLRKSYESGFDRVLILEDDCRFIHTDININNTYDMLYLGCNRKIYKNSNSLIYFSQIGPINESVVKINECGTTHAIIYSRTLIEQIISFYPNDDWFFTKAFGSDETYYIYDVFLNWFTEKYSIQKHCVYPIMCTQCDSFSDIQFCDTNYSEEIKKSWL